MGKLAGKVALVTGASRGIGRAIAERFAYDGAAVAVNYSSSAGEADEVVRGIEAAGGRAVSIGADLSKVAEIRRLFAEVDSLLGGLDILVNNAAMSARFSLAEMTEEAFDQVFALNAKAVLFACQEAARRLGDGGRIVNVSSSTAHFPLVTTTMYSGSKAAVEWYTAVLAQELGPRGVTVNSIAPGATVPGMFVNAPQALRDVVIESSPFKRLGHPEDIARVVSFLVSEDAAWVTGQNILVNGGASM